MGLSINDSVYSCVFFFLTGLHFFHLVVGLLLLSLLFWSCSLSSGILPPPIFPAFNKIKIAEKLSQTYEILGFIEDRKKTLINIKQNFTPHILQTIPIMIGIIVTIYKPTWPYKTSRYSTILGFIIFYIFRS